MFCRACQMQSRRQRRIWRNKKKGLRISTFGSWEATWKNRRQRWPRSIDSSSNCSRTPTCSVRCKSRNHLRRGSSFSNHHRSPAVGLQTPNFKWPTPTADSLARSNPANPGLAERGIKIDEFNKEIDQRKRQQAEIRREMAVYQAKIDSAPKVRALQSGIARDYDKARLHYQELLAKKNEAEMTKAAKKQMEPTFKVVSPASLPETPSETPHQFIAKLSGLLWGPLVAIGLVRSRRKTGEEKLSLEEVISQSGVPVLASIPWIPLGSVEQAPDRDSLRSSAQIT